MKADQFITSLGFPESYRVGGSVRDELLGRKPKDADYMIGGVDLMKLRAAVAAKGGQPSKLQLRDGRQVGVRANVRGLGLIEIALPRTEMSTGPLHTDFEIVADPLLGLADDAQRRDFTINALYRDVHTGKVMDPTGWGRLDIENKRLRTTHPDSFRDDPLRILRAVRFVSTLAGFSLEHYTYLEMERHAWAVSGLTDKGVSGTALDELCKILMGRRVAKALRILRDVGALAVLLPELEPMIGFEQESLYHDMTTDEHTFTALDAAAGMHLSLRVRMALLLHDSGKPEAAWKGEDGRLHYYAAPDGSTEDHDVIGARIAETAMNRLNAPAKLRKDVVTLVRRHMVPVYGAVKPAKVRRWRAELGDDLLADLLKHRLADAMGKGTIENDTLVHIAKMEEVREDAQRHGVPTTVKELPVSGGEIRDLGVEGAAIGKVQRQLLHEVVAQPKLNNRDWVLNRAQTLARRA
jgi:tRNA nucleotidyltransferase (CCA-adding enzyme)